MFPWDHANSSCQHSCWLSCSLPTLLLHKYTVHKPTPSTMVIIHLFQQPLNLHLSWPQAPRLKSKQKRAGPDIISDIPLHEGEVVNEITVTLQKKWIMASLKPVHIPLAPTTKEGMLPPLDSDVYSDAEDTTKLPAAGHSERKGQSCSVSVCTPSFQPFVSPTHKCLDKDWGVAGVQRPVCRWTPETWGSWRPIFPTLLQHMFSSWCVLPMPWLFP